MDIEVVIMPGNVAEVLESIAKNSSKKGLKASISDETLTVDHPEYPVKLVIYREGEKFVVELKAEDGLEENIEELLNDEIDPRAELEDALDLLLSAADYAVKKLELAGFKVVRKTREGVLDVYDALESFLE